MKTNIFIGIVFMLLCYATFQSIKLYLKEKEVKETTQRNLQAAIQQAVYYKTEAGNLAMKSLIFEASIKDLKNDIFKIAGDLKNLKVGPANVKVYSESGTETKYNFYTFLKDSIINKTEILKKFDFKDDFLNFQGSIHKDTLKAKYSLKDTIIQVCYYGDRYTKTGKKRPKWWIFAKRRLMQTITAKNPNTQINYNKFILVQ